MVVRVGFSSLEDLSSRQRTTTVAALRKGHLNISNPVPWTSSGSSPVLRTATSFHLLLPEKEKEVQLVTASFVEHDVSQQLASPTDVCGRSTFRHSDSQNMASTSSDMQADPYVPPKTSHGQPLRHKSSSEGLKDVKESGLSDYSAASSSQNRSSTNESVAVTDSSMSPQNRKKRRSGSIRLAWRKIFHKRDRSGSSIPSPGRSKGHDHHKSESAINTSPRRVLSKVTEESRNSSKKRLDPEDEYFLAPPLEHSGLPFPMNVNAPRYKSSLNASRESSGSPSPHRRRATVSSTALSATEASTRKRLWLNEDNQPEDSSSPPRTPTPLIGLAITSNISQKRRSRSADHLYDIANQQNPANRRRRSAEIQYWRSNRVEEIPDADEHQEEEQEIFDSRHDSAQVEEILPSQHTSISMVGDLQPRSASSIETDLGGSRRASKTEAETISRVDQRLSTIEMNMAQLASSMEAFSHREGRISPTKAPVPQFRLGKAPKVVRDPNVVRRPLTGTGLPSSPRDVPRTRSAARDSFEKPAARKSRVLPSHNVFGTEKMQMDGSSTNPAGPSHLMQDSAESSSMPHAQFHNFSTPFPHAYSQAPQSPAPPQSPGNMLDHLAPLYSALRYERAERKRLEALVLQLQRDLLDLTTIVAQRLGYADGYPTPSPELLLQGRQHAAARSAKRQHAQSAYDALDDDGEQDWEDAEDGLGGEEMF